jgi:TPR repeat protein
MSICPIVLSQNNINADFCMASSSHAVIKPEHADLESSFASYKRAAEANSHWSMVMVAHCLRIGSGVKKDPEAALEWLYKAALDGYVPAFTSLWIALSDGVGGPKNDAAAFPWCKRAAEAGDPRSCDQLGRYYRAGIGGEQNDAEAARLFLQAATNGDINGAIDLGRCFEGGHGVEKDVDEAVRWYAIAALSSPGGADAWSALARVPVPPSQVLVALELASANKSLKRIHDTAYTLAKVAYQAAAFREHRRGVEFARLSGDADCISYFAWWLCRHEDFESAVELTAPFLDDPSDVLRGEALFIRAFESQSRDDHAAAAAWCRKAADAGSLPAMAVHARNLFSGLDGVDRDVASSIEWNEKAVRRGHRPAGVHLAVQIRLGLLPGEPDHGRAAKLLSDALGADSSMAAQFFLGCALLDGLGIECDQARGTEMIASALRCETFAGYSDDCFDALSSATPSGIPWESSALLHGLLAESGFGRVRNVEAARRCYLEAIEQAVGVSYATHATARLAVLAHGAGDNAQAVDWLHKALAGAQPPSTSVLAAVQELRDVIALDERLQALCGDVAIVSSVEIEQAATFDDRRDCV